MSSVVSDTLVRRVGVSNMEMKTHQRPGNLGLQIYPDVVDIIAGVVDILVGIIDPSELDHSQLAVRRPTV